MLVHALDSDLSCLCVCVCACWSINLTSVCAGHGQSLRTHQHDSPECQEGNVVNHWCFSDRFCFFWWSKPPGNTFNAAALSFCPFALLSFCGDNSSTKFCVCAFSSACYSSYQLFLAQGVIDWVVTLSLFPLEKSKDTTLSKRAVGHLLPLRALNRPQECAAVMWNLSHCQHRKYMFSCARSSHVF
jgi:hypothetical protein